MALAKGSQTIVPQLIGEGDFLENIGFFIGVDGLTTMKWLYASEVEKNVYEKERKYSSIMENDFNAQDFIIIAEKLKLVHKQIA